MKIMHHSKPSPSMEGELSPVVEDTEEDQTCEETDNTASSPDSAGGDPTLADTDADFWSFI